MLLYEKVVDGVRKLFGSKKNIPTTDDVEVTFKKEDGTDISSEITRATKLFDAGQGKMKKADGTVVNAWIDDESVIPKGLTPVNTVVNAPAPAKVEAEPEIVAEEIAPVEEVVVEKKSKKNK